MLKAPGNLRCAIPLSGQTGLVDGLASGVVCLLADDADGDGVACVAAWHAVAADFDGFLRWAYNSWVENPLTDSRFRTWPAGDTYMVYPDARSSIRFERLVEGIQDAEKIRILRKQYTDENTAESLTKLNQLNEAISYFNTMEPSADWQNKLNEAKKLLNR